jgi:hypothetical protein
VSIESESPVRRPDWEKAHEVAMALLLLCERHRRDRLRVRPWIPFLESFEREGWIEDSNVALGWVELTDAGQAHAREMLAKHFGIVLGGAQLREERRPP